MAARLRAANEVAAVESITGVTTRWGVRLRFNRDGRVVVRENLPEWQAALRSHADRLAAMRMQTETPLLQALFWIAKYFCRFVAGLAAGVLAGYASHLILDFFTPASLPVI